MPNSIVIEVYESEEVIRATSICISSGMRPHRVVLRKLPGKFVTHNERLTVRVEKSPTYDRVLVEHESFDSGHYFDFNQSGNSEEGAFALALQDFNRRAEQFGRRAAS